MAWDRACGLGFGIWTEKVLFRDFAALGLLLFSSFGLYADRGLLAVDSKE